MRDHDIVRNGRTGLARDVRIANAPHDAIECAPRICDIKLDLQTPILIFRHPITRSQRSSALYPTGLIRPITWPSGSLNMPRIMRPMISSGPIMREPPRLSAWTSAASTSGTVT